MLNLKLYYFPSQLSLEPPYPSPPSTQLEDLAEQRSHAHSFDSLAIFVIMLDVKPPLQQLRNN